MVLAAQEMMQEPKNERGGMGRGNPRFPAMFFHAGYSSLVFFSRDVKFSDLQIQILKNGLHFKLKLHQLWRITL